MRSYDEEIFDTRQDQLIGMKVWWELCTSVTVILSGHIFISVDVGFGFGVTVYE
jgi:hypothetical protein